MIPRARASGTATIQKALAVATPAAQVETAAKTEGVVAVDGSQTSRVSIFDGSAAVAATGAKVNVPANSGTRVRAGLAPEAVTVLPGTPVLAAETPRFVVWRGPGTAVDLRWAPSERATRYRLQLARDEKEVLRLQRPMLLTRQPAHALAPLEVRVPGLVALQRSQLPAGALAEVRGVIAEVTMQEGVVVTLRSTGLLLLDADGAPVTAEGKLLIRLSRSTCFGRCPAYEVAVDRVGTVKWDGQSAVRATGARTRRIPRAQVRALLAEIESAGFFAMADQYPRQATDHPTYTLEVVDGELAFAAAVRIRIVDLEIVAAAFVGDSGLSVRPVATVAVRKEPLWLMALWNSPLADGMAISVFTLAPPPD